jgi:hypothetical protein
VIFVSTREGGRPVAGIEEVRSADAVNGGSAKINALSTFGIHGIFQQDDVLA